MTVPGVVRGRELPRKTLHFTTAVVPIALAAAVSQRMVALVLLTLFGIACAVEYARRRWPSVSATFESTVGAMLRPHEAEHGITGATWLLAAFALVCIAAPTQVAIAATWAGAVGDGAAALVGTAWRRRYGGTGKTLIGSLSCLLATAVGAWWLADVSVVAAVGIGIAAALVERPAVALDDNVRVTAGTALAAVLLLRLGA
jgi:dolichol kinase